MHGGKHENPPAPKRFCSIYFPYGVSLPKKKDDSAKWQWFPDAVGRDYKFNESLKCLEPLREHVSVLGGLSHPHGRKIGGPRLRRHLPHRGSNSKAAN